MGFITWDLEQFGVGVDEMNEQHIKWIALINELHVSLTNKNSTMSTEQAIKDMMDYARLHFKHEEDLMQSIQFPDYKKHKQAHDNFILKLDELNHNMSNGTIVLRTQIMSILKNWLEDHICKMDKAYGTFISSTNTV